MVLLVYRAPVFEKLTFYCKVFVLKSITYKENVLWLNKYRKNIQKLAFSQYSSIISLIFFKNCFQAIKIILLQDRKSTRLNSSHVRISYAVFCLKKKKKK